MQIDSILDSIAWLANKDKTFQSESFAQKFSQLILPKRDCMMFSQP